jgi:segregation and condensation protein B
MNEHDLKYIIEATLLAAGKPVTSEQLLELFDERERPTPELLQTALGMLAADYENRGIELVEVASGWRIQVRPRTGEIVSRLWQERPSKYSRALLETLALVAYRQPITRSEIEEIRGVSISSTIMRTLQERNWIRTVGHREVPGRPELLGTTREFLDYFGLKSLDQLPTLAELKDIETIGVQLELPSGPAQPPAEGSEEAAAAATGEETVASSEEQTASAEGGESSEESSEEEESNGGDESEEVSAEASDGTNDDSELSADAEDGDEDSDVSPTMVAADDDEHRLISEPPREE